MKAESCHCEQWDRCAIGFCHRFVVDWAHDAWAQLHCSVVHCHWRLRPVRRCAHHEGGVSLYSNVDSIATLRCDCTFWPVHWCIWGCCFVGLCLWAVCDSVYVCVWGGGGVQFCGCVHGHSLWMRVLSCVSASLRTELHGCHEWLYQGDGCATMQHNQMCSTGTTHHSTALAQVPNEQSTAHPCVPLHSGSCPIATRHSDTHERTRN